MHKAVGCFNDIESVDSPASQQINPLLPQFMHEGYAFVVSAFLKGEGVDDGARFQKNVCSYIGDFIHFRPAVVEVVQKHRHIIIQILPRIPARA